MKEVLFKIVQEFIIQDLFILILKVFVCMLYFVGNKIF